MDCVSLYTSVNVNLVIEELNKIIYKNSKKYFDFGNDEM